mmetsp:Transcript_4838/g.5828  ORF Transcript_4838/g.5828 Transcript_4838/m.5828 type:complete len:92 (+) Transcript_4838:3-278(+)
MHLPLDHVTEEARARHCTVLNVDQKTAKVFNLSEQVRYHTCWHAPHGISVRRDMTSKLANHKPIHHPSLFDFLFVEVCAMLQSGRACLEHT